MDDHENSQDGSAGTPAGPAPGTSDASGTSDSPGAPGAKPASRGRHAAKKAPSKSTASKGTAKKTSKRVPAKQAVAKQAMAKSAAAKSAAAKRAPARQRPADRPANLDLATGRATEPANKRATEPAADPVTEVSTELGAQEPEVIYPTAPEAPGTDTSMSEQMPAPGEPVSADDVQKAREDNRLAQVLYHDWEARTYDDKWSISFDERCISYARDRFSAVLGPEILRDEPWPYRTALEIGAGTGFFSLNLKQAGVLDQVHVCDVSAGMVDKAKLNAQNLGFEVIGTVSGAESLPYDDGTFDVVVGHAVIHHIPDVESALREVLRVLKPGGRFVIAGEPTRIGDWYARRLGRITWGITRRVTHLKPFRERWAKSTDELDESSRAAALEAVVDLHTFVPEELAKLAERAGARRVHTQSEELLAAFVGWPVRTFEAAVNPERLGWGWSKFAYRSWLRLSAADRVLARAVPQKFFYNVGITGIKGA